MNRESLIEELESYKYDCQYYQERLKDIDKLKYELDKDNINLIDMNKKDYDTTALELKIKETIYNLEHEQARLLTIVGKKEQLENKIDNMPQPFKNILFLKYIKGYSFDEIATKMSYSSKRIYQLHKEAINIYCDKYAI